MDQSRKYIKNTSWLVVGRLVKATLNFAVGIAVARYLGPERFGALNYAMGVVLLFTIFAAMGLDNILVRELVGKDEKEQFAILGSASVLRVGGSGLAILLTVLFLIGSGANSETWILTLICAASFFFIPAEILRGYFEASVDGRTIVFVDIVQTLISSALRIYFILVNQSVFWFGVCWLSEWVFAAIGLMIAYRVRDDRITSWKFDWIIFKHLFKESLPLLVSAMAIVIYQQFDKVMLKSLLEENANDQIGLYSAALRIIPFVTLIPQMIRKALMPSLINVKKHDAVKYKERSQLFLDLMTWVGIGLSLPLFLCAPFIIFLYGSEYAEAKTILQVVAWKGVLMAMSLSSGAWILVEGKQKWVALRNISGCIVNIAINWFLIPRWGAIGAAVGTLISFVMASFVIHAVIPVYRTVFFMQVSSLIYGFPRLVLTAVKRINNH